VMVNKQTETERSRVCVLADHATILLGSNLGKLFTHIASPVPSLLSSKILGYKREYSDWTDLTA